uniref:Uncharacterized protein n=1 Tax=Alexandrium andersonii TaxID=327968 RepID=A0A7S2MJD8_9DINO|mmetsp:Transcript_70107/g.156991  ORF Transcript_70107/g.156991 Transcript_70107/m.156991 type:complete len:121 (+) Transcript_70107:72-434(+)
MGRPVARRLAALVACCHVWHRADAADCQGLADSAALLQRSLADPHQLSASQVRLVEEADTERKWDRAHGELERWRRNVAGRKLDIWRDFIDEEVAASARGRHAPWDVPDIKDAPVGEERS